MNKFVKGAFIFTSGVSVGFGVCGTIVIKKALESDRFREVLSHIIADKIGMALELDSKPRRREKVSYCSYHDETIFATRDEAEALMAEMRELIKLYGFVTVADLHDLTGTDSCYTDNNRGWTSLRNAEISRVRGGWAVILPEALPLA